MRRCAGDVQEYDANLATGAAPAPAADPPTVVRASAPAPSPAPEEQVPDDHRPAAARFERGQWHYGRLVPSHRGPKMRFFPSANFTDAEKESAHFVALRASAHGEAALAMGDVLDLAAVAEAWPGLETVLAPVLETVGSERAGGPASENPELAPQMAALSAELEAMVDDASARCQP